MTQACHEKPDTNSLENEPSAYQRNNSCGAMKYQKLDENRKHGKNEHNKIMERI
jgi:hypothetical protein